MNKRHIADLIADREGITPAEGWRRLNQVLDALVYGVVTDGYVGITGFGALEKVDRAQRGARNPQTGEALVVPARTTVRFRPGQALVDLVQGNAELPQSGPVVRKAPKGTFTAVDAKGKRLDSGQ